MATGTKAADLFVDIGYDLSQYRKGLAQAKTEGQSLGQQIRTALRDPAGFSGKSAIGGLISDLKLGRPLAASLGGALKGLSVGGLTTGLNALHSVGTRVFGALRSLASNVFKGIALGVGIGAFLGVEQVVSRLTQLLPELINRGKSWAEAIHAITLETGASAEAASKQAAIFNFLGGTTDQYATQVVRLAARIKASEATLNAYGVTTRDVNGNMLNQVTLLDNLRAVFSKLPDSADKTALAFKLFGQRGAQMFGPLIHFIGLTDAQVTNLGADVNAQGLVISDNSARIADEMDRARNRISNAITGLATQVFIVLGPTLTGFFDQIAQDITGNSSKIKDTVTGITKTVLGFAQGLLGIKPAVDTFSTQFTRIDAGGANTTATLVALELKLKKLKDAFHPVAHPTPTQATANLAAIREMEGVQKAIDKEKQRIDEAAKSGVKLADTVTQKVTPAFDASTDAGLKFANDVKKGLTDLIGTIGGVAGALGGIFGPLLSAWNSLPPGLQGAFLGAIAGGKVFGLPGAVVGAFIGSISATAFSVKTQTDAQRAAILEQAAQFAATASPAMLDQAIKGLTETGDTGRVAKNGVKLIDPFIQGIIDTLKAAKPKAAAAAGDLAAAVASEIAAGQDSVGKAADTMVGAVPNAITAAIPRSRQAMLDLLHAVAGAVSDTRTGLDSEISKINELAKKPTINPTKELENLLKARTSPLLLQLLKSPDLEKRTAARALAADLDSIISKAKPRAGIMSATSKAIIADLQNSTNPELKAFGEWFKAQLLIQAQVQPTTLGPRPILTPDGKRNILPSPATPADQNAAERALHQLLAGATNSVDPFIRNDAQNEGQSFAANVAKGIADQESIAAAQAGLETLFGGIFDFMKSDSLHRAILDAWHTIWSGLTIDLPSLISGGSGSTTPTPTVNGNTTPRFDLTGGVVRDSGGPVWAGLPFLKSANQMEVIVPRVDANILTMGQLGSVLGRQQQGSTSNQAIYIDTVNLADGGDEMSVIERLRFLSLAQGG